MDLRTDKVIIAGVGFMLLLHIICFDVTIQGWQENVTNYSDYKNQPEFVVQMNLARWPKDKGNVPNKDKRKARKRIPPNSATKDELG